MERQSKSQLFEIALKRAALEDINLLDLADPKWLSKKLEICNLQPDQISRVMSWRTLRDFLAWGTSAGQVKICDSGMGVDAYQVTIYKLKDSALIHDLLRLAKRIPGMKQVKSPDSREAVFEVRLPAPEPEKLTWFPQGILRPAPRPQGEQRAMFDEKTGSALIDNIIQEVRQALPEAATVGDNIRYSEG